MGWHWFEVYLPDTKTLKTPWGKKGNVFSHKCRYITPRERGNQCQQNSSQIICKCSSESAKSMVYKGTGVKAATELLQCRRQVNSNITLHDDKENKWHNIPHDQWRQKVSETRTLRHPESQTSWLDAEVQQCRHTRTKQKAQSWTEKGSE